MILVCSPVQVNVSAVRLCEGQKQQIGWISAERILSTKTYYTSTRYQHSTNQNWSERFMGKSYDIRISSLIIIAVAVGRNRSRMRFEGIPSVHSFRYISYHYNFLDFRAIKER